jgi:ABC-type transport system substrate-binding protein
MSQEIPRPKPVSPGTTKKVRQALNMAINRDEMLTSIFKGRGQPVYVSGYAASLDGWNPEWAKQFDAQYGYNPEKAKALLKEAGYPSKQMNMKVLGFSSPGEEELPQVAEALSLYFHELGFETEVQIGEWSRIRNMIREKDIHCCIYPNIISLRPIQEWIRVGYFSQEGVGKTYEDPFIDQKYEELVQTADPAVRDRLAREVGDYLFAQVPDIPLFLLFNEVVANPKVVSSWTYPGTGGGRTTHFHLLKAAK